MGRGPTSWACPRSLPLSQVKQARAPWPPAAGCNLREPTDQKAQLAELSACPFWWGVAASASALPRSLCLPESRLPIGTTLAEKALPTGLQLPSGVLSREGAASHVVVQHSSPPKAKVEATSWPVASPRWWHKCTGPSPQSL